MLFGSVDAAVRRDNIAAQVQPGDDSSVGKEDDKNAKLDDPVTVAVLPATS